MSLEVRDSLLDEGELKALGEAAVRRLEDMTYGEAAAVVAALWCATHCYNYECEELMRSVQRDVLRVCLSLKLKAVAV